jgi:hypothetical protein
MPSNDLYRSNGSRALSHEEIAEEALRVQKLSLILQSLMMVAMLGTFLIALNRYSNDKK